MSFSEADLAYQLWLSTDPSRIVPGGTWTFMDCVAVAKIATRLDGMVVKSPDELNVLGFEVRGTVIMDADGDVAKCYTDAEVGARLQTVWYITGDDESYNRVYFTYPVQILRKGGSLHAK